MGGRTPDDRVAKFVGRGQQLRDRNAAATVSLRLGDWLSEPANARRVVDEVAEVTSIALSKVRDEHIESLVRDALTPRFREERLAPLLGGLLASAGGAAAAAAPYCGITWGSTAKSGGALSSAPTDPPSADRGRPAALRSAMTLLRALGRASPRPRLPPTRRTPTRRPRVRRPR